MRPVVADPSPYRDAPENIPAPAGIDVEVVRGADRERARIGRPASVAPRLDNSHHAERYFGCRAGAHPVADSRVGGPEQRVGVRRRPVRHHRHCSRTLVSVRRPDGRITRPGAAHDGFRLNKSKLFPSKHTPGLVWRWSSARRTDEWSGCSVASRYLKRSTSLRPSKLACNLGAAPKDFPPPPRCAAKSRT